MPRFFLDETIGDTVTITGGDARHIALSLRMQTGDALTLCNGAARTMPAASPPCPPKA